VFNVLFFNPFAACHYPRKKGCKNSILSMRKHMAGLLVVNMLNRFAQLGLLGLSSLLSFSGRKAIFEIILKKVCPLLKVCAY
jgi:hypothetical protein